MYNGWPCKDVESFKATFSEVVVYLRFSKIEVKIHLFLTLLMFCSYCLGFGEQRPNKEVNFYTLYTLGYCLKHEVKIQYSILSPQSVGAALSKIVIQLSHFIENSSSPCLYSYGFAISPTPYPMKVQVPQWLPTAFCINYFTQIYLKVQWGFNGL